MMLSKVSGLGFPSDDTAHDLPLSSVLAANIPVPTTNGRRLASNIFTDRDELRTALEEYKTNKKKAKKKYGGPPNTWVVSGITDMSGLFKNPIKAAVEQNWKGFVSLPGDKFQDRAGFQTVVSGDSRTVAVSSPMAT
eukprot:scaffold57478_cov55-Phaeocystis_antarctica.AAC.1